MLRKYANQIYYFAIVCDDFGFKLYNTCSGLSVPDAEDSLAFGSVLLKHLRGQTFRWIFSLTLALLLSAVVIRTVLNYAGSSRFPWIMGLLAVWLILVITETGVTRRASWYIFLYLAVQTVLVGILLLMPGFSDFFATLTIILSMQAFRRLEPAAGSFFIALWAVLIMFALFGFYRYEAIALAVLYSAAGILFGAYTVATLRSEEARKNNESLAGQIDEANNRLRAYSSHPQPCFRFWVCFSSWALPWRYPKDGR